jgi:hypothetical protein
LLTVLDFDIVESTIFGLANMCSVIIFWSVIGYSFGVLVVFWLLLLSMKARMWKLCVLLWSSNDLELREGLACNAPSMAGRIENIHCKKGGTGARRPARAGRLVRDSTRLIGKFNVWLVRPKVQSIHVQYKYRY